MDPVSEIKARLPIEELVGQYCQIKKKGRTFTALCPFHNDSKPSLNISPEKGIAYCFACQTGGDIFSFYQAIEGVDFRQALKDLAEKVGVEIKQETPKSKQTKDEKEQIRACLECARDFYTSKLSETPKSYLTKRSLTEEFIKDWKIGFAPDSFSETYEHLLKSGFSRKEIIAAGMGIQKELNEEKIFDRFRNRIMIPINDHQGRIVGFGGRTLGDDPAKYMNSPESPIYQKSLVLYNLENAKSAIREEKSVILVEGYFDVFALSRIGIRNVVAVSGTALTEEHCKLLRRFTDTIILSLDRDPSGREAAKRAFRLLTEAGLNVNAVELTDKDPDEAIENDAEGVTKQFKQGSRPYIELLIDFLRTMDLSSAETKRLISDRLLPLIACVTRAVERSHYVSELASILQTTTSSVEEDLSRAQKANTPVRGPSVSNKTTDRSRVFSPTEIALCLLLSYPEQRELTKELIEPEDVFCQSLHAILLDVETELTTDVQNQLPEEIQERFNILHLYCEDHGFLDWSESLARSEIRKHIIQSNKEFIRSKQEEITTKLTEAQKSGNQTESSRLMVEYAQVLKLAKRAQ